MKKFALLATTAAIGYSSETCDVVLVSGKDGPVRVNKADFEADQEKPTDERQFKRYSGKDEPEQSTDAGTMTTFADLGIPPQAAPAAPDFSGRGATEMPIDPDKNAAAPSTTSNNQRLAMKDGNKWFMVDGMGTKLTSEVVGYPIEESGYTSKVAVDAAIRELPR